MSHTPYLESATNQSKVGNLSDFSAASLNGESSNDMGGNFLRNRDLESIKYASSKPDRSANLTSYASGYASGRDVFTGDRSFNIGSANLVSNASGYASGRDVFTGDRSFNIGSANYVSARPDNSDRSGYGSFNPANSGVSLRDHKFIITYIPPTTPYTAKQTDNQTTNQDTTADWSVNLLNQGHNSITDYTNITGRGISFNQNGIITLNPNRTYSITVVSTNATAIFGIMTNTNMHNESPTNTSTYTFPPIVNTSEAQLYVNSEAYIGPETLTGNITVSDITESMM